jgi:hypothetical protein
MQTTTNDAGAVTSDGARSAVRDPRKLHVLTQYLWPDDAPTGIYAEHVADAAASRGIPVVLVGGGGSYRPGGRAPPRVPIVRLSHWEGRRGRLVSTAIEYGSVNRALARYIEREVAPSDLVVLTSAPPTTVMLHRTIRRRGAVGIYWLQDYYPRLLRGVWEYPEGISRLMSAGWNRALAAWTYVVKSAGNLGYHGPNARVIRNWNTLDVGAPRPATPRTALYSGNLGWGHDIPAFLLTCDQLRDEGYSVTVRGDGPGMQRLPSWIRAEAPIHDPDRLIESYWDAELHLVAADPRLPDAIFPSKLWNARAVGRPIRASGFSGAMAKELEIALTCDYRRHLGEWVDFLQSLLAKEGDVAP